jgi:hypothetical protein
MVISSGRSPRRRHAFRWTNPHVSMTIKNRRARRHDGELWIAATSPAIRHARADENELRVTIEWSGGRALRATATRRLLSKRHPDEHTRTVEC